MGIGLLELFSGGDVADRPIQQEVMILVVPVAVEVLEVVGGMVVMIPGTDHDTRIDGAVEVLEAAESRSNLFGDDPLQMMRCGDLRNCC